MNRTIHEAHAPHDRTECCCPFVGGSTCLASLSSMSLDHRLIATRCGTERYDDCPIFLAKVLRRG